MAGVPSQLGVLLPSANKESRAESVLRVETPAISPNSEEHQK